MLASTDIEPGRVLTRNEAARYLGLSLRTLERLVKNGAGLSPIKLSQRRYGFRQADLDRYVGDRVATT